MHQVLAHSTVLIDSKVLGTLSEELLEHNNKNLPACLQMQDQETGT